MKADTDLLDKLKDHRKKIADEKGVPAYIIFSDKTLNEMACIMPTDRSEFRTVAGVGDFKLEEYGSSFLRVITDHLAEAGSTAE